jgi:hypothetical protein
MHAKWQYFSSRPDELVISLVLALAQGPQHEGNFVLTKPFFANAEKGLKGRTWNPRI